MLLLEHVGRCLKRWEGRLVIEGLVFPPLIKEMANITEISNRAGLLVSAEYPRK